METRTLVTLALAAALSSAPAVAAERASAQIVDRQGATVGKATLNASPHGVLIHVSAKGLPPGPKAIHIHGVGTCDDGAAGFVASKGHLNPAAKPHGLMNPEGPDAGDLPNLFVHADGSVEAEFFTTLARLGGAGEHPTILDADGAALVIHENRDDHATQPIGGAGPRHFCGVIRSE
jgi:Cu-Zn family superoxide dismutase